MPSIAAHMAVAKIVGENLHIYSDDFIRGNLLPDILLDKKSHNKIKGKYFMIPNIDYFKESLDLSNVLYLGYLVHLLLDKYFLDEFVLENISNLNVFEDEIMYNDYDMINYKIVKEFDLDIEYLKEVLSDFKGEINKEKLEYNLKCLSSTTIGETKYLKFKEFSRFLYNISIVISEEIRKYEN